ncbi:diguanylate cyclase (GGDEF)-like protein [Methylobacterium sp. BE186]|uniref:putative bifunctional diguanylate cyclase/phosphodiesterase n=1 Tax=Methylobacterium sp. BE186 TaxID=2817715 RepID=UPI002860F91B|nr:EAL domain-containing protein [Methylobacterium sp. BE186]MDR7036877.1 diguanylate cyclase (GGDEF)-like protein [Methylobacterium sp. BE186]
MRVRLAQARALSKNAPFFYAVHSCNALFLSYAYLDVAPFWLTAGPLAVLLLAFTLRSGRHLQLARRETRPATANRQIIKVNLLTGLLVLATCAWSFSLAPYGTPELRMLGLFYDAFTIILCAVSLMHVRSAGFTALSGLVPVSIASMAIGSDTMQAAAVTFLVSGVAVLYLILLYSKSFHRLVGQHGELKRVSAEARNLARLDLLTSLPNRRSFFADLEAIVASAAPDAEIHLAVIDIDGFKTVNEMYGHAVGDEILREAALRLVGICGAPHTLGRLGGDEFGLIFGLGLSGDEAFARCTEIEEELRAPFLLPDRIVRIGVSIGLASAQVASSDAAHLHEQVHYALREAKLDPRASCQRFTREQEERMSRANRVAAALRNADFRRELSLVFQPVIDAERDGIIAFEALARWTSPEIGAISPVEFVTAAEKTSLIGLMTDVLLTKALEAAATWPPTVHLYFNLSARDITMPDFAVRVADIVRASGVTPGRIAFEVTETAIIGDFAAAKQTLDALKELGVSIALDDFGTGFSSLSYVHRLPIDKLKIDRSFTSEILTNRTCRDIVRSVIGLCQQLGIDCVAEGVETHTQMMLLGRLGCRSMQGFYFAKPMPAEEAACLARTPRAPGSGVRTEVIPAA